MKSLLWHHLPSDDDQATALAAALNVHPTIARLLCMRGFGDPEQASRFLNPTLAHLNDPFRLADMNKAIPRLERAIAQREKIAIHGDYDVDGITSTVILRRALEMLGGDVMHFLPERMRDGYGLQPGAIDRLHAEGVRLIVSVDCGIRAAEAALRARHLGVDLIITDHHEPDGTLPEAFAIINPKRHDCTYPDKYLAGVGVALKVVQALCDRA
ncbi:MAG: DHH family phosphoesterase, partial [Acidobacteria bacterium]|nr:DHH family phosphoesterase [Acidobacteriota bacterium]